MVNEKEKSLIRSKGTIISLADILAKEGAGFVPGGATMYDLAKLLAQHVKAYLKDRTEERLLNFHHELLSGIPSEDQTKFLEQEFSIDSYYSLLNHALQDEEEQKVDVYAKIFKGLQLGLISNEYRLHLIRGIRELKYSDFEFMRRIYINEKYEFKHPGNRINQVKALTVTRDPVKSYSIQTLIRFGFLSESDDKKPPWPTNLLNILVEFLYNPQDLLDEALKKKAEIAKVETFWVFFVCDFIGKDQGVLSQIDKHLGREKIKYIIAFPKQKTFVIKLTPIVALCFGPNGAPIDLVKSLVDIDKKMIIQLIMPGADTDNLLPNKETFDLSTKDEKEIKRLVTFVKNEIEKNFQ